MNVLEVVGAYQFSEPEETTVNRLWSRHLMLAACRKALLSDQVSSSRFQHLLAAALIPTRPKAATPFCARRFLPQLVLIAELPENVKSNPQTNCTPMENWDEPNWDMFAVTLTHWLKCGCWMVSPWCMRSPMSGYPAMPGQKFRWYSVAIGNEGPIGRAADWHQRLIGWMTEEMTFDWLNDWRNDWLNSWMLELATERMCEYMNDFGLKERMSLFSWQLLLSAISSLILLYIYSQIFLTQLFFELPLCPGAFSMGHLVSEPCLWATLLWAASSLNQRFFLLPRNSFLFATS
jgi:hypothetical protein